MDRRLHWIALLAVGVGSAAGAQALPRTPPVKGPARVAQQFSLSALRTHPAVLEVFKDGLHTVEFPSAIDKVFGPSTGLLQLQVSGNLLLITGRVAGGQPPLLVRLTDGSTALLEAKLLPARAGSNRFTVVAAPGGEEGGYALPAAVRASPPKGAQGPVVSPPVPAGSAAVLPSTPSRPPQGYARLGLGYGWPAGAQGGLSVHAQVGTRNLLLGVGARAGVAYRTEGGRLALEGALVKHLGAASLGLGGGVTLFPSGAAQVHLLAPLGVETDAEGVGLALEVAPTFTPATGAWGVGVSAGLSLKF